MDCLNNMHLFFDELCERAFGENVEDAQWDYDDYFLKQAKERIELITNPLDIQVDTNMLVIPSCNRNFGRTKINNKQNL